MSARVDEWLGELPRIGLRLERDVTRELAPDEGFLRLRRAVFRSERPDGTTSPEFRYDLAEREAMDAVAVVLTSGEGASMKVCLRSSLRPPLFFRTRYTLAVPEPTTETQLWEIPAGLIEVAERGEDGIRACAARETLEETGFALVASAFETLGPPTYPSPGVTAEKIYFFRARVDEATRGVPTEDGSPLEADAAVRFVPLDVAKDALDEGRVLDAKTELGLRRLFAIEGVR